MRTISRHLVPASLRALPAFALALALVAPTGSASADASPSVLTRAGRPWIISGGAYLGSAPVRDITARATAVVKERAGGAELVSTTVERFGDGDTIQRFEQAHHGLPVIGRGAAVRLSSRGQPRTTVIDLEDTLPADTTPTVTSAAAATVASSRMRFTANASDAHLVVWPTRDRGARLAYVVIPRIPEGLPTAPRAIIDAMTGEILEARDLVTYAKASTYEFNPVKTPTLASHDLALTPAGTNLTNPFIQSTNCIDNKTVKPVNFGGFSTNVHVCDLMQVATANPDGDFNYTPADVAGSAEARTDEYSEVSIYYHAAKAYAFYRDLQGDDQAQVVLDKPLRLIANLQVPAGFNTGNLAAISDPNTPLDTFQNAFFSPAGQGLGQIFDELYGFNAGALWFGQGPQRDYSYDGDVVYHEFTHAVVEKTLKLGAWHVDARGAVDSPGAMNEGLADFFSSAITGDPDVGEYAAQDLGSGTVIRSLANHDACPTAIIGEVHADSTVFSGGLWEARAALVEADRHAFDAALYKAMRNNAGSGDLGYEDLVNLFLAVLKTDLPDGATKLEAAMTARGLLPGCERILPFDAAPVASFDSRIGFAAPGTMSVSIKGVAPGIVQIHGKLPPGTQSVTVTFKAASSGGGNPLGGQGTPFTPVVLAKFGKAITWSATTGHDADVKIAATGSSATIPVPDGTTADSIYVQIANSGQSDGSYDDVALAFVPGAATEPPVTDTPPPAAPAAAADSDTGCGCATVGGGADHALLFFPGLVAVGALLARRRRRRQA